MENERVPEGEQKLMYDDVEKEVLAVLRNRGISICMARQILTTAAAEVDCQEFK